jgi:hypothetical protein
MRLIHPKGRRAAAILVSALAIGGCTVDQTTQVDTLPRVPVSGTVTLDGTPLTEGMIQFDPAEGTKGPTTSAEVSGGKFSIEKAQGPVPGKYKVVISGRPPAKLKPGENPGGTPKVVPDPVPAQYNTSSTLTKDVTASGPNQFDFPLVSK